MQARFAGPVRAASFAIALVVAACALLAFGGSPAPARGMGPLPACRYDDILTSPRGYADWPTTLVDTILRVSSDYVPPDLVDVSAAGIGGNGRVRAILVDDLREMAAAAKAAGAPIAIQSAYRSYETQKVVFANWVAVHGRTRALQLSARPGHSEHQLGIGIDFKTAGGGDPFTGDWQLTAQGKWMKAHAWEYGFVMSYPRGKLDVACYDFEPWHFRYVGRELAANIQGSGLTPREYLWANFTTTVVPAVTPKPPKSPRPSHSARPTETPPSTVTPSEAPTEVPSSGPTPPPPTATPLTPPPSPSDVVPTVDPMDPSPTPFDFNEAPPGLSSDVQAAAVGGAVVLAALVIGWMVLRRGRSGVGL